MLIQDFEDQFMLLQRPEVHQPLLISKLHQLGNRLLLEIKETQHGAIIARLALALTLGMLGGFAVILSPVAHRACMARLPFDGHVAVHLTSPTTASASACSAVTLF